MLPQTSPAIPDAPDARLIKCVAWDLDNTVWDGVLLEGGGAALRPGVAEVIRELDRRGILNSIASRNDPAHARDRLSRLGLAEYFVHPQIGWGSKGAAVAEIARRIRIEADAVAFIDDEPSERAEVAAENPAVLCLDPATIPTLLGRPEFMPAVISDDARQRRLMIQAEALREQAEAAFQGSRDEFLAGLGMCVEIGPPEEAELRRAEELTLRTHQLNSTGRTYTAEQLSALLRSPDHLVLMATLEDRFGSYGRIGLALVERAPTTWTIKLLLMSCRVLTRGIGAVMLSHLVGLARDAGVRLCAEFAPNERNRMMHVALRFAGFRVVGESDAGLKVMERREDAALVPLPAHVRVISPTALEGEAHANSADRA